MEQKENRIKTLFNMGLTEKLRIVAFFVLLAVIAYAYLFNSISYTANRCRTEYSTSGSSITVAPGDPIGSIIYGHGMYLTPGTYKIRIDGYNEYTEYNRFQIYSETLETEFAAGVFVPGMDIVVQIDETVPDWKREFLTRMQEQSQLKRSLLSEKMG